MEQPPRPEEVVEPGGSLVDLALLAARHKGLLLVGTVVGTLAALAVSLVVPAWYQAEVRMVAPKKGALGGGLMLPTGTGELGPLELLTAMGGSTEPNLLGSLLQSRTVSDAVIAKFGLQARYRQPTLEQTRVELWQRAMVDIERKSSVISLKVEDTSPTVARDIAMAVADEANRLNNQISSTRAGQERRFLEKRVVETQRDLTAAEVALKDFSVKHKIVDVQEQVRTTIQAVARIRGEIMAREVMLSYLSSFAAPGEANQLRLRREVAELKRQLEKLETGAPAGGAKSPPAPGKAEMSAVTPIADLPEIGLEYSRLVRNRKIQETVFELLTKQLELAKLSEASDTSNAQIIDAAALPTKRVRPKLGYYGVFGFIFGLLVCFAVARFLERLRHDPVAAGRWRAVGAALRGSGGRRGEGG